MVVPSDTLGNVGVIVVRVLRIGSIVVLAVLALVALTLVPTIQARLDDAVSVMIGLLALAGTAVIISVLGMVLFWVLHRETGTTVLPFEVAPGMNLLGSALSDQLVATLQRISNVHQQQPPSIQDVNVQTDVKVQTEQLLMPRIAVSHEDLTGAVAELGTISAGVVELSLGKLLVALKLLRRDPKAVIIRGSVQGDRERCDVVVRIEIGPYARAFAAFGTTSTARSVVGLIDDLTYQLIADGEIVPKLSAHSWQALKFFTEALDAYSSFTRSGSITDLHAARQNGERLIGAERGYKKVFGVTYNVGIAYLNENDTKNALSAFKAARESDPADPAALIGLGATHHRMGNYATSIDLFNQALAIAPAENVWAQASAFAGLGSAWSDRGDLEQAASNFQQAANLSASAGDPLGEALNLSRLARRYLDKGQMTEAVRLARAAVNVLPQRSDSYTRGQVLGHLAFVLADAQQYDEAERVAHQALAAAADVPSAYLRALVSLTLSRTLLLMGRFKEAAEAAEAAAIERSGFRHTALAFLGLARMRLQQFDLARQMFTEAIQEADAMIAKEERNFGALYAKALALDGLASLLPARWASKRRTAMLTTEAAAVRQLANQINPNAGVIARQTRIVQLLEH
jgi:tetratricopeptide (TPR) repeat protein